MPYTPFTLAEVLQIFRLSEANGGHAGAQHVSITNQQLWSRVEAFDGPGVAARTSFLTFQDQLTAALQLLNDGRHDAQLEEFRVHKQPGRPYRGRRGFAISHPLLAPIRMRYGIGGGSQVFPCRDVVLVLDKAHGRPRDMHVITFFGSMGEIA